MFLIYDFGLGTFLTSWNFEHLLQAGAQAGTCHIMQSLLLSRIMQSLLLKQYAVIIIVLYGKRKRCYDYEVTESRESRSSGKKSS